MKRRSAGNRLFQPTATTVVMTNGTSAAVGVQIKPRATGVMANFGLAAAVINISAV